MSPGILESIHKNIYYIDGCSQEEALTIMIRVGELLIQDGLVRFGFGCHNSQDELMIDKYNGITFLQRIQVFVIGVMLMERAYMISLNFSKIGEYIWRNSVRKICGQV